MLLNHTQITLPTPAGDWKRQCLGQRQRRRGGRGRTGLLAQPRAAAGLMEEEAARHHCRTRGLQLSGYHPLGLNGIQPTEDTLLQHCQVNANPSCLLLLPLLPPRGGCRDSSGLQSTRLKSCQRHRSLHDKTLQN